ncbi:MAG TPA: type 1 glutamine amidotransferase domain-containing protein [Faecalibacter sp.]
MNKKVAILTEKGFEEIELTSPKQALEDAGFTTAVISPQQGKVKAKSGDDWSKDYSVDVQLSDAKAEDYDALLLPGGVINPDLLRVNDEAIQFVRHFFEKGKPVAAICHGPQTLINAEAVKGKKMTSVEAIALDLKNAGALWEDSEVVEDQGLVTSRVPKDLPAFNQKIVEIFSK